MNDSHTCTRDAFDERWMIEWVRFGFVEMERYLRRQAQFDTSLRLRQAIEEA